MIRGLRPRVPERTPGERFLNVRVGRVVRRFPKARKRRDVPGSFLQIGYDPSNPYVTLSREK
jgi:hypothetical protein